MSSSHDIRETLLRLLEDLDRLDRLGEDDTKPVELDQTAVGRLARMDAMQVQAMALENERRRQVARRRIMSALARLDSGEYGICIVCDEPIGAKRLQLDPAVPTCIRCAKGA